MEASTEHVTLGTRLLHWAVSAIALMITAYVVPGFKVKGFMAALVAALVIGLANVVVYPVLFVLTLPINILTLFLFTFVLNGIFLKICAAFVPGFDIDGILSAIFGSVILSVVGYALHSLML